MITYNINENLCYAAFLPEEIDKIWDSISKFLEKSIIYLDNHLSIDQLKQVICSSKSSVRIWAVFHKDVIVGAFVTEISTSEFKTIMDYQILGGETFDSWIEEAIKHFEKIIVDEFKVNQFRIIGRLGWAKKMKKFGYNKLHAVISRNV